jgi:hypothetical protein
VTRAHRHGRPERYELGDLFEIVARFGRDVWQRAIAVPSDVNGVELVGRAMLWTGLLVMSWNYVFQSIVRSQMSPSFVHFIVARTIVAVARIGGAGYFFVRFPFGTALSDSISYWHFYSPS